VVSSPVHSVEATRCVSECLDKCTRTADLIDLQMVIRPIKG
jgi:hypothetical protein